MSEKLKMLQIVLIWLRSGPMTEDLANCYYTLKNIFGLHKSLPPLLFEIYYPLVNQVT